MMAALFAFFTLSMAAIFYSQRKLSIALIVTGVALSLLMFWHHVTSVLEINW